MSKKTESYKGVTIEIEQRRDGVAKVRIGDHLFTVRREVQIWIEEGNPHHAGGTPLDVARHIIDQGQT